MNDIDLKNIPRLVCPGHKSGAGSYSVHSPEILGQFTGSQSFDKSTAPTQEDGVEEHSPARLVEKQTTKMMKSRKVMKARTLGHLI